MQIRLLLTTLAFLLPSNSWGCSCFKDMKLNEAYGKYDEVFLASVYHYHPKTQFPEHGQAEENIIYLSVLETFKGNPPKEVVGKANLVWINPSIGSARMSSCQLSSLDPDLKFVVVRNGNEVPEFGYCSPSIFSAHKEALDWLRESKQKQSQLPHSRFLELTFDCGSRLASPSLVPQSNAAQLRC